MQQNIHNSLLTRLAALGVIQCLLFSFFGASIPLTNVEGDYGIEDSKLYADHTAGDLHHLLSLVDEFEIEESENGDEKDPKPEGYGLSERPYFDVILTESGKSILSAFKSRLYRGKTLHLFILYHSWKSHLS